MSNIEIDHNQKRTRSFREMTRRVFEGQPNPQVLFQPRIEPWYHWHTTKLPMPEKYHGVGLRELFDDLQISMRYIHYFTGMPSPVVRRILPEVRIRQNFTDTNGTIIYETPYGDLIETFLLSSADKTWSKTGFPVKTKDDFRKLRWLSARIEFSFSAENFEKGSVFMGERGEPQFYLPPSPYQDLALEWMKFEDFIYALADWPEEVEATIKLMDENYERLYKEIVAYGKLKIVNFGENIHEQLTSPRYLERYLIPFYEKRSGQLRKADIFTHIHIDGYFHSLLKYLRDLPFDGLEALTPQPQGDVSLEEIKAHIGDKVLLDGIPAVMFADPYSREDLMQTVEKIVKLFHPRLILGVSDEVPEGADGEAIERVRMISAWCHRCGCGGSNRRTGNDRGDREKQQGRQMAGGRIKTAVSME
jgi:methionine synthase II (cobalamin-independent)